MKSDKSIGYIITISVLSAFLAISIFVNIFICAVLGIKNGETFKEVLLAQEVLASLGAIGDTPDPDTNPTPQPETSTPETPVQKPGVTKEFSYNNDYVKIKFLKQEVILGEPVLKFEVENISDKTLTISFKEVYIDGYQATLSGVYCDNLDIGKKAIVSFNLWSVDYEDFTTWPSEVSFVIETQEYYSFLTLDYSNVFSLPIN